MQSLHVEHRRTLANLNTVLYFINISKIRPKKRIRAEQFRENNSYTNNLHEACCAIWPSLLEELES